MMKKSFTPSPLGVMDDWIMGVSYSIGSLLLLFFACANRQVESDMNVMRSIFIMKKEAPPKSSPDGRTLMCRKVYIYFVIKMKF